MLFRIIKPDHANCFKAGWRATHEILGYIFYNFASNEMYEMSTLGMNAYLLSTYCT